MVAIKLSGEKVEVTRKLTLPKTGSLAAITLTEKFELKINLSGIKPKSEVGLEILALFQKAFEKKLSPLCDRQNKNLIENWEAAVTDMSNSKSNKDLSKKAKAYSSKVVGAWGEFNEQTAQKAAPLIMDEVVKFIAKKHNQALKKPKISFFSKQNTANRISMEKAFLAALVLPVAAANPVGLVLYLAGAGGILLGAIEGAYKSTQKRSGKLLHSMGVIEDNLGQAEKLLGKLSSEKKRLADFRRAMNADTAVMSRSILKLESDIKAEVVAAKKKGQSVDMSQVKRIRQTIVKLNSEIAKNNRDVSGQSSLMQALADAEEAIKNAAKFAKAEKDLTNSAVDFFSSNSGNLSTGIGLIQTFFGQMAKSK